MHIKSNLLVSLKAFFLNFKKSQFGKFYFEQ